MTLYLALKSLHLISVISWMAGLLYLPRIFVYHSENDEKKDITEVFKVMERRLFNYIMMPAMILTWVFGILLVGSLGFSIFSETWMVLKSILVLLLTFLIPVLSGPLCFWILAIFWINVLLLCFRPLSIFLCIFSYI